MQDDPTKVPADDQAKPADQPVADVPADDKAADVPTPEMPEEKPADKPM